MAKKFFKYSFQVRRTKKGLIMLLILILILGIAGFTFYKSKNNLTKFDNLNYRVSFGMNKFNDSTNSCDISYRVNYEKNTCGTYCIKKIDEDPTYIEKTEKEITKNGFNVSKVNKKSINGTKWEYIYTKNEGLVLNYYVASHKNKMYVIELLDQTSYLSKANTKECKSMYNNFFDSLTIK